MPQVDEVRPADDTGEVLQQAGEALPMVLQADEVRPKDDANVHHIRPVDGLQQVVSVRPEVHQVDEEWIRKWPPASGARTSGKRLVGITSEWNSRKLTSQVCDVSKGLLGVSKIAKGGSRVAFDSDEAYNGENKLERLYPKRRIGMCMLTLWARKGLWRQSGVHALKPAYVTELVYGR